MPALGEDWANALSAHLKANPSKAIEAPTSGLRQASVLAPIFWRDGEPFVLLTQRPMSLRTHPGQISFPGGGREDEDVTPLHTGLRELREELGITADRVRVLGMLGTMPTVTGFFVTPFVGFIDSPEGLTPDSSEVERVLEAPLWRLRRETRQLFYAERDAFVWAEGNDVVWGATWLMLNQLLEHIDALGRDRWAHHVHVGSSTSNSSGLAMK